MGPFDVVIVGSGFGGAIPALRLAQVGASVLVLERGRRYTAKDFRFSWDPRYLQTLQSFYLTADYRVAFQSGRTLGGGSVVYAGAMLRAPSEVFAFEDDRGFRVWPAGVDRAALDPHYATVEAMMEVRQARWDEVPKAGGVFAMMLDAMGLTCDRGRFPYVGCLQCGFCEAGCSYDRNRSLMHNYIPAAEARGAEFLAETDVRGIAPDGSAWSVTYRDRYGSEQTVAAGKVILAAGGIETPALLLRSAGALSNLSPQVGRNFNNNGDVGWYWMLPEGRFPSFENFKGRNNAVMITYAFWDDHRITIHTGCAPPAIFGGLDVHRQGGLPWGLAHKRLVFEIYPRRLVGGIAIGLIEGEGSIGLDGRGDARLSFPMTPKLRAYTDRVLSVAGAMASANGAEVLRIGAEGTPLGGAHQLSTCRMGDDPGRAVVDPNGRVYGYAGLYISDASTLPGGTGVNPALTVAANAERIAAAVVAEA